MPKHENQGSSESLESALVEQLRRRNVPAAELLAGVIIRSGISEACSRLNAAVVLAYHDAMECVENRRRVDQLEAACKGVRRGSSVSAKRPASLRQDDAAAAAAARAEARSRVARVRREGAGHV